MVYLSDKLTRSDAFRHMRCETLGLLCWLLDSGADEHWVTPPRKALHERMVLDRRNYSHAIEELEALGIVVREGMKVRVTLEAYDPQYGGLFRGTVLKNGEEKALATASAL